MLAQRIASINSLTSLCESNSSCSVHDVKSIVGSDARIGDKFLNASPGFGGSCFEKDLLSLIHILAENGDSVPANYWQGVLDINQWQKQRLADLVAQKATDTVSIFGFAYKAGTGDTRCCQAAFFANYLAEKGLNVRIHDPKVTSEAFRFEMMAQFGHVNDKITFFGDD